MARGSVNTGYTKQQGGINLTTSLIEAYRVAGGHNVTAGDFVEFLRVEEAGLYIDQSSPINLGETVDFRNSAFAALDDSTFILAEAKDYILTAQVFKIENGDLRSGPKTQIENYADGGYFTPGLPWIGAMSSSVAIVGFYKEGTFLGQTGADNTYVASLSIDDVNITVGAIIGYGGRGFGFEGYRNPVQFIKITDTRFVLSGVKHNMVFPGARFYYTLYSFKLLANGQPSLDSELLFSSSSHRGTTVYGHAQKLNNTNILCAFSVIQYNASTDTSTKKDFAGTVYMDSSGRLASRQTIVVDNNSNEVGPVVTMVFPNNNALVIHTYERSLNMEDSPKKIKFDFISINPVTFVISLSARKTSYFSYRIDGTVHPNKFVQCGIDSFLGFIPAANKIIKFSVSFSAREVYFADPFSSLEGDVPQGKMGTLAQWAGNEFVSLVQFLSSSFTSTQITLLDINTSDHIKRSTEKGSIIGVAKESGMEHQVIDIYTL